MNQPKSCSVLIVCAHRPGRSPSQRYRFEQYLPLLDERGFEFTWLPLLSEEEDRIFYSEGNIFRKALLLAATIRRRWRQSRKLSGYDIIFIQREACFTGHTFFEERAARSGAYVIFDFDDSIWLEDTSPGNKKWSWLKKPAKFFGNVRRAHCVIAGNDYLASKALLHNPNTVVIPTTLDTSIHLPMPELRGGPVVTIGWSGSISTVKHLQMIVPVLARLQSEMPGRLRIKIMGAQPVIKELTSVVTLKWTEEQEVRQLNTFDIGIMPLPDDEWSRGKCALKGLSYMACGIPAVMSAVGINNKIIEHGVNGMLAATDEDWYQCLRQLILDEALRKQLGERGRQTVVDGYSVARNAEKYFQVFEGVRDEINH